MTFMEDHLEHTCNWTNVGFLAHSNESAVGCLRKDVLDITQIGCLLGDLGKSSECVGWYKEMEYFYDWASKNSYLIGKKNGDVDAMIG